MPTIDVAGAPVRVVALLALGLVVGAVSGLYGVGGAFLLTPSLTALLGVPLPIAIGSGLCQTIGTATGAWLKHRELGQSEPRIDVLLLAGSVLGSFSGARLVSWLEQLGQIDVAGSPIAVSRLVLSVLFMAFLAFGALSLLSGARGDRERLAWVRRGPLARGGLGPTVDLPRVPLDGVSALGLSYAGLVIGLSSGLLGVGGGLLMMPLLVHGVGLPLRKAAGSGILVLVASSVFGTMGHALAGRVHLGLAMTLLVGSGLASQLGARWSARFSARALTRGFIAVVALAMVALAWDLFRRWRGG